MLGSFTIMAIASILKAEFAELSFASGFANVLQCQGKQPVWSAFAEQLAAGSCLTDCLTLSA